MTAGPVERARALLELRRPAEAEKELRGLLARDPENVTGHAFLALALARQGRSGEAISAARESVRLAPDNWAPHYVAAKVHHRAGRPRDAVAAVRTCLALSPEYAPAWELLARVHLQAGQWPRAAGAARRGLAAEPENAALVSLLALALTMLGDAQARETAGRAVRLDPESALAHLAYGRAELAFGAPGEAARAFREVLRLAPGFDPARDLLVTALKRRNPVYRLLTRLRRGFSGGWLLLLLPAVPPIVVVLVLVALLHWAAWAAEAVTTLRLARGAATRLLLGAAQARTAALCCCLLAAGAALLPAGLAAGQEPVSTAGVALMALVTAVQEAAHTSAPRGRMVLYGWSGILGAAVALSVIVSVAAVALLAAYAALATVWIAAGVRRLSRAPAPVTL